MKALKTLILSLLAYSAVARAHSFDLILHSAEVDSGHAEVDITFDGQTDRCLVDTGSRVTTVKSHILPDAPSLGKVPTGGLTGAEQLADRIQTTEIKSKNWTKNNLVINRVEQLPANCIIGNDFFLQESLSIDYERKQISTGAQFEGETFPLLHYANKWFGFTVELNGQTLDSLFDTGAGATVIDERLVEENPEEFEFLQEIELVDATNAKAKASLYKMKELKFGKWSAQDATVLAYSFARIHKEIPTIQIVIGHNIINKHRWYLNNQMKEWSVY